MFYLTMKHNCHIIACNWSIKQTQGNTPSHAYLYSHVSMIYDDNSTVRHGNRRRILPYRHVCLQVVRREDSTCYWRNWNCNWVWPLQDQRRHRCPRLWWPQKYRRLPWCLFHTTHEKTFQVDCFFISVNGSSILCSHGRHESPQCNWFCQDCQHSQVRASLRVHVCSWHEDTSRTQSHGCFIRIGLHHLRCSWRILFLGWSQLFDRNPSTCKG